ncbi:MAG: FtsX-like permease family protein [Myxococcus sp.]|nr:FtsX-like permease family protein [Myxococcus sp.]
MLSHLNVLVRIAFANIISSALNVFVGLVLLFGAALLVVGGSIFTTLDDSLSKSIVDSIAGHLQVFSARSKDQLEIYGKVDGSDVNLVPLEDFPALKAKLLAVPNVAKVVPMGGASALVSVGNTVDVTLEQLRGLYRTQRGDGPRLPAPEFEAKAQALTRHVRNIVAVLQQDLVREDELTDGSGIDPRQREALAAAATDAFWSDFDADPFGHLELLENRVAPLVADGDILFMRCLGTDLDAYQESFSRMAIVEGGPVPKGTRGVLLPRFFSEELLKLKNARRLDKLRDAREAGRRLDDASDKELQRFIRENTTQTREIVLQLDGDETALAVTKLQQLLGSKATTLEALLPEFFAVTDATFDARYAFFYEVLAPMLTLYRAKVGDTITLKSFGRSGSTITVLVKVYGIFELRGLEKSPLAGANGLVDIVTFRDLYGFLGAEMKAELDALKAEAAAKQVDREGAEDALFGGDAELIADTTAGTIDETRAQRQVAKQRDTFEVSEIDDGVVLHAAVLLKDGSEPAQRATAQAIEQVLAATKPASAPAVLARAKALAEQGALPFTLRLAAKDVVTLETERAAGATASTTKALLALKAALKAERPTLAAEDVATLEALYAGALPSVFVVDWATAAGFLGKFIEFFRLLLVAVIAAFAFIALIVVTLGMTIATLQRTQTIGTMRAIGAQRSFVVSMVLVETVVLALTFGAAGAAVGAAVVRWLHVRGIPAFRDELYFFFSGPVLRPELTTGVVVQAVVVTTVVSLIAVIIPTWLATRVAPVTAMQATE